MIPHWSGNHSVNIFLFIKMWQFFKNSYPLLWPFISMFFLGFGGNRFWCVDDMPKICSDKIRLCVLFKWNGKVTYTCFISGCPCKLSFFFVLLKQQHPNTKHKMDMIKTKTKMANRTDNVMTMVWFEDNVCWENYKNVHKVDWALLDSSALFSLLKYV